MNKMDDLKDLVNISKLNELLNKKEAEEEKKASKVVWVFAIIGIIAAVAAAVYGIYRFFAPDYLEDQKYRRNDRNTFESDLDPFLILQMDILFICNEFSIHFLVSAFFFHSSLSNSAIYKKDLLFTLCFRYIIFVSSIRFSTK